MRTTEEYRLIEAENERLRSELEVQSYWGPRWEKEHAEVERLRARINSAPVAIMDTRDVLGICAPTEADFPALYALQGKRVRLVLEEVVE